MAKPGAAQPTPAPAGGPTVASATVLPSPLDANTKAPEVSAKTLAAPQRYCTAPRGRDVVSCDWAKTTLSAGRFGPNAGAWTAAIGAPLTRSREGAINGLTVTFLPGGYDQVANRPDFIVLQLHAAHSQKYGPFIAVPKALYERKQPAYNRIGAKVDAQPHPRETRDRPSDPIKRCDSWTSVVATYFAHSSYARYVEGHSLKYANQGPAQVIVATRGDTPANVKRALQTELARKLRSHSADCGFPIADIPTIVMK